MLFRLAQRATPILPLLLVLAACSSLGVGQLSSVPDPKDAQYGSGALRVGLITRDEVDDLADGAPDSAFLAAQLSAEMLRTSPITLIVRRYDGTAAALKRAEEDLLKQEVRLVIGPDDSAASLSLAGEMGRKGIVVLSLSGTSEPKVNLYAFGMSGEIEASLVADEMRRRHYRSIVLVSNPAGTAKVYASQLATAVTAIKIAVRTVDGTNPTAAATQISAMASTGQIPSAVVFAESASDAQTLMKQVRVTGAFAGVPVVGTSAWAFDPASAAATGPGWYLAPDGNTIARFAEKFTRTYSVAPTPDGALAHDLIVMAAALPQLFPGNEPYAPEVLRNDQGFMGVTGKFWFTPDGQVHRNLTVVELVPGLAQPAT